MRPGARAGLTVSAEPFAVDLARGLAGSRGAVQPLEPIPKTPPGVGRLRARDAASGLLGVFLRQYACVGPSCLARSRSALGRRRGFWDRLLRLLRPSWTCPARDPPPAENGRASPGGGMAGASTESSAPRPRTSAFRACSGPSFTSGGFRKAPSPSRRSRDGFTPERSPPGSSSPRTSAMSVERACSRTRHRSSWAARRRSRS